MSTTRGLSGFSYDFGVQIARGTLNQLVRTVAGVTALTGSIVSLVQNTRELDMVFKRNQIAFGGYANTLKTFNYATNLVAKGIGYSTDDLLSGIQSLGRAGLNAKDNIELVRAAANATGNSFGDVAKIIQQGNFGALADMGVITQRSADSMQAFGFNTYQASRQVKKLLDEANKRGLFSNSVQTIDQIMTRFTQFKEDFVNAIIGDPKDPNGLAFNVKKYMTKIADFIERNRNHIIMIGKGIGQVFLFVIRVVGDFMKRIFKHVSSMVGLQKKTAATMQEQLYSFGLWLEVQRVRIRRFFDEYGKYIWMAVKALLFIKGIRVFAGIIAGALRLIRILRVFLLLKNPITQMLRSIRGFDSTVLGSTATARSVGSLKEGFKGMAASAGTWAKNVAKGAASMAAMAAGGIAGGMLGNYAGGALAKSMGMGDMGTMVTEMLASLAGAGLGAKLGAMVGEGIMLKVGAMGLSGGLVGLIIAGVAGGIYLIKQENERLTKSLQIKLAADVARTAKVIKQAQDLAKQEGIKNYNPKSDVTEYTDYAGKTHRRYSNIMERAEQLVMAAEKASYSKLFLKNDRFGNPVDPNSKPITLPTGVGKYNNSIFTPQASNYQPPPQAAPQQNNTISVNVYAKEQDVITLSKEVIKELEKAKMIGSMKKGEQ